MRIDYNKFGHPVYQVLADMQDNIDNHDNTFPNPLAPPYPYAYNAAGTALLNTTGYVAQQFRNNISDPGGDGWVRLITFDLTASTIHFWTYSPLLNSGNGWYAGQCKGLPCDCEKYSCDGTFEQAWQFSDFYWQPTSPGQIAMPVQVLNAPVSSSLTIKK